MPDTSHFLVAITHSVAFSPDEVHDKLHKKLEKLDSKPGFEGSVTTVLSEPHVVLIGNFVDGFIARGPFADKEDADAYASNTGPDCHVVPMNFPEV